jgi:hypothetical protein
MAEITRITFPAAYKAAACDPDTLTYDQAMAEPDEHRQKWIKAMRIEIQELESRKTWDEVPVSDAKTKIIPGTWVFRHKRTPDGELRKYKARYCCWRDSKKVYMTRLLLSSLGPQFACFLFPP